MPNRSAVILALLGSTILVAARCPPQFVHARGSELYVGDSSEPIHLRGVAFGNRVWDYPGWHDELPVTDHDERDFERVHDMGMNVVRFYLNARTLEDPAVPFVYKDEGWAWLDQNVAWARRHGVYLILNIHVPLGGYQSNGEGGALWNEPLNQDRFVALWTAIARRYHDEPIVAGYDLLNEPLTTTSADQWRTLAQRTIDAIRTVDRNHLLVIERLQGVYQQWNTYDDLSLDQFLVNDPEQNVMYDFHYYVPWEYAGQNTPWTTTPEGGTYPDPTRVFFPDDAALVGTGPQAPLLAVGDTDWTFVQSDRFTVTDPSWVIGVAALGGINLQQGAARYDRFTISEYDPTGAFVREVMSVDPESAGEWSLLAWSGALRLSPDAHDGTASIELSGTQGYDGATSRRWAFLPRLGYSYAVSGWVKGAGLPADGMAGFTIAFMVHPAGTPVFVRDRAYLEHELLRLVAFGKAHQVPINVGEFGVYRDCFEDGRNGLQWVSDVLDLLIAQDLNFTYHVWRESSYGIYQNDDGLPDPAQANEALIALLTGKLQAVPAR